MEGVITVSAQANTAGTTILTNEKSLEGLLVVGLGVILGERCTTESIDSTMLMELKVKSSLYSISTSKKSLYPAQLWAEMFTDSVVLYMMSKL